MTSIKLTAMALLLATYNLAVGQGVTVGSDSGAPGGTAVVPLGYVQQNDLRNFQIEIAYDESVLTPQTTTDATFGELVDGCPVDLSGVNWDPSQTRCIDTTTPGTIAVTVSSGPGSGSPALDPLDPFGSITFDIASGAAVGSVIPLAVTVNSAAQTGDTANDPSLLSATDGSVTLEIVGSAGFASNPSAPTTVDLGAAEVDANSNNSPFNIRVSEVGDQTLDVTAIDFSGPNAGDFSSTTSPFMIVDGGDPVDVDVSCVPSGRGARTATLELTNNSSNQPNPQYTLECDGLAPMVSVDPTSQTLGVATVNGSSDTDTFTVTNDNSDGFSSSTNVTITQGAVSGPAGTPPTISVAPLSFTLDPGANPNAEQVVTTTCESDASTTPGTYTSSASVSYTAPGGAMIMPTNVSIECVVSLESPGYTSDPAAGTTIDFMQVAFGGSATETIAIGNEGSSGTGEQAELDVTGAVLSDTNNYSIDPASPSFTLPPGATNGTESIDVSCTPSGVGDVPAATLTIQTNDGDQEYNLACEGDGDFLTSNPSGGLNLGTVPPGTTTNEGTISFTNNRISGDITVNNCSFAGDTEVITSTAGEADFGFTLQPGESEKRAFQCTPPDISPFALNVSCDVTGGDNATLDFTVSCAGRPLVVPTMSRWGLVVMSLMLLLFGGFASRRMMA